jgi:hypothetical protein
MVRNWRLYSTFAVYITKHRGGNVDRKYVIARMLFDISIITKAVHQNSRICKESDACDKAYFNMEPTLPQEMRWLEKGSIRIHTRILRCLHRPKQHDGAHREHMQRRLSCPYVLEGKNLYWKPSPGSC